MAPRIIEGCCTNLTAQVFVCGDAWCKVYQQVILLHIKSHKRLQSFRYRSDICDVVTACIDILQRCQPSYQRCNITRQSAVLYPQRTQCLSDSGIALEIG